MAKLDLDLSGFDELEKSIENLGNIVEKNVEESEGQLIIDYDYIFSNIPEVNEKCNSTFSNSSTKEDMNNFFDEQYQIICAESLFQEEFNPKSTFNNTFIPFAKVE